MADYIMLDLEAMGTGPDAAIVAIGACAFDLTGVLSTFYQAVDLQSSLDNGGTCNGATIMWWLQQAPEARLALTRDPVHIDEALAKFTDWYRAWTGLSPYATVWGDGSDFDNVVLASAYKRAGLLKPWGYKQNRDYRTMKNLRPDIVKPEIGVAHNARDDAVAQALHLIEIMKQGVPPPKPSVTVDEIVAAKSARRIEA